MSTASGNRGLAALVTAGALVAAGAGAYLRARREVREPTHEEAGAGREAGAGDALEAPALALALPGRIDAIVVGGGSSPELNQTSLEEDVRLASETFGAEHTVSLFAGGPGTRSVQVEDLEPRGDALLFELGELLAPHGGRSAHYQPTTLALHGAGTLEQLEAILDHALGHPGGPLLVYLAGHGERGTIPSESRTLFWGGDGLDAVGLATWLEERRPARAVRFVVTSCFAGGLGEIAFTAADRARGASGQDRCGLFATSWDEEASGCDPDPVRAHHDGFGLHFLMALAGRDRDGTERRGEIDLDHDDVIGLYEALTRARIGSRSIDVPTTTSEIYLRAVAPAEGPSLAVELPEQRVVIAALSEAMRLPSREEVSARLAATNARKAEHDAAIVEALARSDERYYALVAQVLSRWPVLDDPFHPDFGATIASERGEIEVFLERSPAVQRWAEAQQDVDAMGSVDLALRLELSLLRRLDDAYETIVLAERLRARGGAEWEHYLALRACEWSEP